MRKLYWYLIDRFIGPFIITFLICIFFLLMQFLWKYLDDMVGKGLDTFIVIELMSYAALSLVPMALPLSVLMASVMTFGTLGERLELLAIKTSGISLLKIMRPLIFFSLSITIFAYILANEVIPVTNAKFAALLWSVKEQRPEMIIKEGAFSNDIDGYSIKVNRKNNSTGALLDLMIYDHSEGKGNVSVTLADSGFLNMSEDKQFMVLTLHNGESYTDVQPGSRETKKTYPFRREKFSRQEVVINVKDFSLQRADESFFKDGYRMLKNSQLSYTVDSLSEIYTEKIKQTTLTINYIGPLNESIQNEFRDDSIKSDHYAKLDAHPIDMDAFYEKLSVEKKRMIIESAQRTAQANQRNLMQFDSEIYNRMKWINRHEIEWHRKYTLSLACIIFFFIGAPLGAIIRKGGFGLPVVVSVLMFISYYLVSMIGENFAREDVVLVSGAMWFSTFLYLAIGAFLSHQAITDSLLLSREAYTKFFGRLLPTFSILKNKKGK